MRFYLPFCKSTEFMSFKIMLCQKHANSKVQKPPSQLLFLLTSIVIITITSNEPWNTETQNGSRSTNHRSQTMTVWTSLSKVLFPKRSAKMIVGSKTRKINVSCLVNFRVLMFLKGCAETSFPKKKSATPPLCNHINTSNLPFLKY